MGHRYMPTATIHVVACDLQLTGAYEAIGDLLYLQRSLADAADLRRDAAVLGDLYRFDDGQIVATATPLDRGSADRAPLRYGCLRRGSRQRPVDQAHRGFRRCLMIDRRSPPDPLKVRSGLVESCTACLSSGDPRRFILSDATQSHPE